MMKTLIQIVALLTLLLFCKSLLIAQKSTHFNFIGINPSVTVETYYNKGELDVNIFPLVYQRPLTRRFDFRVNTICNLGIRNNGTIISHLGFETAFPIFLTAKEEKKESSKGLFAAPIISLTRNRPEMHNNIGVWIESGYNLLFDNKFAMTFGLQLGQTYFAYDNGQNKWGNHFGIKIIIGKWI